MSEPLPEPVPRAPAGTADRVLVGLAVAALVAATGALVDASARANGGFVYPLDDAYIHLGMARTLAEHGTWGINPGEFASATSSPLFTALLAACFTVGLDERLPLLLNLVAGAAVLALVARGAPNTAARALGLGLVLVLGPLPFLAALGMEHVLHAALVLALAGAGLDALERAPGTRPRLVLAGLGAAAALTRYESLFLVAPLGLLLWHGGRFREGVALVAGAVGALGLVAAASVAAGGLPIPNSIVMKSALGGGWAGLWRANVDEGTPVFVLVAAAAGWGAARAGTREARALGLFAATALLHLAFARVGWLFRYEGYLVVWGVALLAPFLVGAGSSGAGAAVSGVGAGSSGAGGAVSGAGAGLPVAEAPRQPGRTVVPRVLLAGAVLAPCALRAYDAVAVYVPHTTTIHQSDVVLARMVAATLPDAPVAVHDIGALSWYTDAPILDLAGLATTEVTELHLARRLSGAVFGELLARRGATYGYTDSAWMAEDPPPDTTTVATLAYTDGDKRKTTRIWTTSRGDPARLRAALAAADLGGGVLGFPDASDSPDGPGSGVAGSGVAVPLDTVTLEGAAVQREGGGVAFYTGGAVVFSAPATGELTLRVRGTPADGRGPRWRAFVGDTLRLDAEPAGAEPAAVTVGAVGTGDVVRLVYDDDAVDAQGNDRNLWIESLHVRSAR